jgi:hypothetical protein
VLPPCPAARRRYAPVRLAFSRLDVERGFDHVRVYNGPYAFSSALLANFTGRYGGSDLPVVQTADDAQNQQFRSFHSMLVVFSTDHSLAASGFEASYSQAFCRTLTRFNLSSGETPLSPRACMSPTYHLMREFPSFRDGALACPVVNLTLTVTLQVGDAGRHIETHCIYL